MKDGIIVLNKPQNWTSSDCVAVCRRVLGVKGVKKVGHGGTLDPMATGVLPVFVGQATRIMEYMDLDFKTYLCRAKLGITTDTLDIWGEVIAEKPWTASGTDEIASEVKCTGGNAAGADFSGNEVIEISENDIRKAMKGFSGAIEQMPPKYSAVRIHGKRLYEYAHKGQEIDEKILKEIKPRRAFIRRIELIEADMKHGLVSFEVECSKGTYIRTICADLGEKLGCGCTMTALKRTQVGNIGISQAAVTAEEVKSLTAQQLEALLLPADYPLVHFGKVLLNEKRADFFSRGNSTRWRQVRVISEPDRDELLQTGRAAGTGEMPRNSRGRSYDRIYKVYHENTGEFLGTGYYDVNEQLLKADKVFTGQNTY